MTAALALALATYLLVADGIVALLVAGLVGPLGALLLGVGLALTWSARVRALVGPRAVRALLLGVAALALVDLFYFATALLDGFLHLLIALILLRLLTVRAPRDLRDAGLMSFFVLVASSAVDVSFGFLFVFVAYLLGATWMLLLHHLVSDSAPERGSLRLRGELAWVVTGASAGALVITAALFFVIPRVGEATLAFRHQMRRMTTGFSERVELGAIGEIETDLTVAMRVHLPDGEPPPAVLERLRWRGLALDVYNGAAWGASRGRRMTLRPSLAGEVDVAVRRAPGPLLRQEIVLEPIGTDALFVAPGAVRVTIRQSAVITDDLGSLLIPTPSSRVQYAVDSELAGGLGGRPPEDLDPSVRSRYLQLPPLPARVGALARQITRDSRDAYAAATDLTAYLSTNLRYSLNLDHTPGFDPIDEFLFARRSGNCEYFASALAIMLRSIGIPSRVVTGFQRGEWNPYGNFFAVRMADAHAWVEVHVAGTGWVTFDPSPRAGAASSSNNLALYLDSLRMQWYRYVVSWSQQDQVEAVARVRSATWATARWSDAAAPGRELARVALAVAALVALWLVWRLWRPRSARAAGSVARLPDFYRRALRVLARRGLVPRATETAREFAARVAAASADAGALLATLTDAYERVRFGAATLTAADVVDLAVLATRLATPGPARV
ncbi:MAG: DUF3488 domain-containing protein [Candidatus Rokubacteria bacterium]|nr:DUF3488 domain-containing protein [Candidatus Rokubacteria bacterium]MBI3824651.1 DUF3488 domain-containing protein [Candidatus Rokubacteria bacterium]